MARYTSQHLIVKNLIEEDHNSMKKKRIHLREIYTSYLASKFAHLTGKNSFCVWGNSAIINDQDLDPNYLLKSMF